MRWLLVALTLLALAAPRARAEEPRRVGIGLYAPSAPFEGPEARLGFVNDLAEQLAAKTGRACVGRVFARAGDLTAAIKKGEIQFAVIDAPTAAALGLGFEVLGVAVRSNATTAAWELVATDGVKDVRALRGKTVAVSTVSGRETAFVLNAMLEGEIATGFFAKVTSAPDALSAAAAVSVGRADAAVVPGGLTLPSGTHRLLTLREVSWPAFAAAPGVDEATRRAFAGALASFRSSGAFARFEPGGGAAFGLSLAPAPRRGPLAVPAAAHLEVRAVLAGRTFAIDGTDLAPLVEAPGKPGAAKGK